MCVTTILRTVEDGRGQKYYRPIIDQDFPPCLLGEWCERIEHHHFILREADTERCATCNEEAIKTALWAAGGGAPITTGTLTPCRDLTEQEGPNLNKATSTGWRELEQVWGDVNVTVQQQLRSSLDEDLPLETLIAILHYIFGLPVFIQKEPLVNILGEKVGACDSDIEHSFQVIAQQHLFSQELGCALSAGKEIRRKQRSDQRLKGMPAASGLRDLRLRFSENVTTITCWY
ncbi:hypothetical protein F5Y18DRAFT_150177 [Xylariaceae sp. FL1019]|nr:hypothetical protein F5Y18DRAFT_150177 [Xylariaceae sp. FL1019]